MTLIRDCGPLINPGTAFPAQLPVGIYSTLYITINYSLPVDSKKVLAYINFGGHRLYNFYAIYLASFSSIFLSLILSTSFQKNLFLRAIGINSLWIFGLHYKVFELLDAFDLNKNLPIPEIDPFVYTFIALGVLSPFYIRRAVYSTVKSTQEC